MDVQLVRQIMAVQVTKSILFQHNGGENGVTLLILICKEQQEKMKKT
jgi:hypothetical protein